VVSSYGLSKGLFNNFIDCQSEDPFLTLHCDNYGVYFERAAGRTRPHQKAKWQIQLPNPKDTKLFSVYIAQEARKAYKNLKQNGYSYDMWLRLGQAELVRTIVSNRRRVSEVCLMSIGIYKNLKSLDNS
jgi:hypothetical protein